MRLKVPGSVQSICPRQAAPSLMCSHVPATWRKQEGFHPGAQRLVDLHLVLAETRHEDLKFVASRKVASTTNSPFDASSVTVLDDGAQSSRRRSHRVEIEMSPVSHSAINQGIGEFGEDPLEGHEEFGLRVREQFVRFLVLRVISREGPSPPDAWPRRRSRLLVR